ncbi:MAG: TIGR00341 family protein [Pseudomonadota bacterium]
MRAIKSIQLNYPAVYSSQIEQAIERAQPLDWSRQAEPDGTRETLQVLVEDGYGQSLMDAIQVVLASEEQWRLTLSDVEATLPRIKPPTDDDADSDKPKEKSPKQAVREALVSEVMGNSRLTVDFMVLTALSAIVAAIGLNEDSVAVVIGAMVIAPLLGPILGFSLAAALGSVSMMAEAAKTAFVGLIVGFGTVFFLATLLPVNLESQELLARTNISPEIIALALASGAAAALSVTGGLSSSLVGVMVAVALLPPSAAAAMYLGSSDYRHAAAAAIVVALNVLCVLISTQIIFAWKGVRPRRWLQQRNAARSLRINLAVWATLLICLSALGFWINSASPL